MSNLLRIAERQTYYRHKGDVYETTVYELGDALISEVKLGLHQRGVTLEENPEYKDSLNKNTIYLVSEESPDYDGYASIHYHLRYQGKPVVLDKDNPENGHVIYTHSNNSIIGVLYEVINPDLD